LALANSFVLLHHHLLILNARSSLHHVVTRCHLLLLLLIIPLELSIALSSSESFISCVSHLHMHLLLFGFLYMLVFVIEDLLLKLIHSYVLLIDLALVHIIAYHCDFIMTGVISIRHVIVIISGTRMLLGFLRAL
jgi:hypothetical protein